MKLTGGEIYFIRERDVLTDQLSEYVKVGIVREDAKSGGRTSEERLKEHQTGNPRDLVLNHVIKTPMVERVETIVHEYFAVSGVRGEWLRIENDDLTPMHKKAQELADNATIAAPYFEQAFELATKLSTEGKIASTAEALDLLKRHNEAHHSAKHFDSLIKQIGEFFKVAIAKNEPGVGKAAKIQQKKSKMVFDLETLKTKYPDLYALFLEQQTKAPSGRFTPATTTKPPVQLAEILASLTKNIVDAIEKVKKEIEPTISLHKSRLELNWLLAEATWEKEFTKAKLQVLCGTNAGIEGVCTWNREEKKTEKFNEVAFKEAHPAEYEKCFIEKEGGEALIVDKKLGYAGE